jgi:hypothetical protein
MCAARMSNQMSCKPPLLGDPKKEPEDWVTGDESMTGAQASYLRTPCHEAGEEFDPSLSKASRRIDELQKKTGRGRDH